jgi:hypothetical protein
MHRTGINTFSALNTFYDIYRALARDNEELYCAVSSTYTARNRSSQIGLRVDSAPEIVQRIKDGTYTPKQRKLGEEARVQFQQYVTAVMTPPDRTP